MRQARDSDTAVLAAIHRESRQEAMPWLPRLHTAAEDLFYFESSVLKNCQIAVAQQDHEIVGFCAWRSGWIDHLYVRPTAFRQGVGAQLIAQPMASETSLYCWTFQRNAAARAFLERRGFAISEMTDGQKNEEKEPDVLYFWAAK